MKTSDDDIPKCVQLKYTHHAIRARYDDPRGIVQTVPSTFRVVGCKSVSRTESKDYKVRYIYDDETDLVLIVNIVDGIGTVITLYLDTANNIGKNKGRFFLNTDKFTKNRVKAVERSKVRTSVLTFHKKSSLSVA